MSETQTIDPYADVVVSGNADAGFPPPEPVAEPSAEPSEGEPEAVEAAEPEESEATKAAKTLAAQKAKKKDPNARVSSLQAEINEHVKARTTARQEREAEEARLATLRAERAALERDTAPPKTQELPADTRPRLKDYTAQIGTKYETYDDAVEAHAEDLYAHRRREEDRTAAEAKAREAQTAAERRWIERLTAFKADHPDYDEVMAGASVPDTPGGHYLIAHLHHSDAGPQLAYALASQPDRLQQLASLPPEWVAEALGELKAELKMRTKAAPTGPASVAPPKTTASPPIKPVSGSPVTSDDWGDPDDMSDAAIAAYVKRRTTADRRR